MGYSFMYSWSNATEPVINMWENVLREVTCARCCCMGVCLLVIARDSARVLVAPVVGVWVSGLGFRTKLVGLARMRVRMVQVKLGGWDQSQYGYWATNGNLTIARQFNSLVNRAQNDFTAIAAARMREAVAKQVGGVHEVCGADRDSRAPC